VESEGVSAQHWSAVGGKTVWRVGGFGGLMLVRRSCEWGIFFVPGEAGVLRCARGEKTRRSGLARSDRELV
jgi:hypothetical protein